MASLQKKGNGWGCQFVHEMKRHACGLGPVIEAARHAWIDPIVAFAARTGARRSEFLCVRVGDVDLVGQAATIREKKRVKGRERTRCVPLSRFFLAVLKDWVAARPGGAFLFCHSGFVDRSSKRSRTTGHTNGKARPGKMASVREREKPPASALTENEASAPFARTLRESEWSVVPG